MGAESWVVVRVAVRSKPFAMESRLNIGIIARAQGRGESEGETRYAQADCEITCLFGDMDGELVTVV